MRGIGGVMKKYVHRSLETVLKNLLKQFPAVAVTGPRQSGKSTLLLKTLPEARCVTLDDPVALQQALNDPELVLGNGDKPVVLDEIQYAPSLLPYIKMRIDRNRGAKGRFILTGSQQFALIKNLGESLAGRIGLLELLPFSVEEASRAGASSGSLARFERACLRGMFPEPTMNSGMDVPRWYASYVQTYLERDIRTLYDIGNLREFERFLQLLAARCSQELHLTVLATDTGVAVNTIKKWISILEACRIIYLLPPYYRNLGKRIVKAPKVYFLDIGMVCYLTGLRDRHHVINGPLAGALFENFCVQEALKAMLSKGVPPRLYFLKTHNGLEVDLLVEGINGRLCPFEFKFSSTPKPAMCSSLERFGELFKDLNPEPGKLVSLSEKTAPLTRSIMHASLDVFLSEIRNLAQV